MRFGTDGLAARRADAGQRARPGTGDVAVGRVRAGNVGAGSHGQLTVGAVRARHRRIGARVEHAIRRICARYDRAVADTAAALGALAAGPVGRTGRGLVAFCAPGTGRRAAAGAIEGAVRDAAAADIRAVTAGAGARRGAGGIAVAAGRHEESRGTKGYGNNQSTHEFFSRGGVCHGKGACSNTGAYTDSAAGLHAPGVTNIGRTVHSSGRRQRLPCDG